MFCDQDVVHLLPASSLSDQRNGVRPGGSDTDEKLRTPARAAARIALEAGPVPDHREVVALGAGCAFVAAQFGFRHALLGNLGFGQDWLLNWRRGALIEFRLLQLGDRRFHARAVTDDGNDLRVERQRGRTNRDRCIAIQPRHFLLGCTHFTQVGIHIRRRAGSRSATRAAG